MLTQEEINSFKERWYTFEEIERIKSGIKNMEEWKTVSEEVFWKKVYENINAKMKEHV